MQMLQQAIQSITQYLQAHREPDQKILVGVSGGPDSMFLLYCLQQYSKQTNIPDSHVIVCTLNHGVRLASRQEISLVQSYASNYTIMTTTHKLPSKTERDLRYRRHEQFVAASKQYGTKTLVL